MRKIIFTALLFLASGALAEEDFATIGAAGFAVEDVSEEEAFDSIVPGDLVNTYDILCESHNYNFNRCALPERIRNVWLMQTHSRANCILGRSWGWDGRSLWVDNGCRGTFRVQTIPRRF